MPATAARAALLGSALLTLALGAAPLAAQDAAEPPQATDEALASLAPAGLYLAARAADRAGDVASAAEFYAEALAADATDPPLLEAGLSADLAAGRIDEALAVAERMDAAGLRSPIADLARQIGTARDGNWHGLLQDLEAGRAVGPLIDGLARAWAWMGEGDTAAALSAFDELAATPDLKPFALYHKALALAMSGDLAGAEAILSLSPQEGMGRSARTLAAEAQVLSALGRPQDALARLDAAPGALADPTLREIRDRIEAGEALGFTLVTTPAQGLSEAYMNLGGALDPKDARSALLYARAALALDPTRAGAALLAGQRLEAMGQPALAREAYALVPAEDPAFLAAEMGRASLLQAEGQEEAALEVLKGLAADHPDLADVQTSMGDLLRGLGRHPEAEAAYDRAIALTPPDGGALWWLHFARALTREGQGDWPGTEEDLRASLKLRPESPQVLNHLGYSMVERGESLPEALDMIAKAVALRPDSGAIVDSLGWAYFKLGRHAEAVVELEKAAALLPTDPVVNDHLGDAYWTVGREREARFQWSRALSFEPDPALAAAIRAKLEAGLSAASAGPGAALTLEPEGATGG